MDDICNEEEDKMVEITWGPVRHALHGYHVISIGSAMHTNYVLASDMPFNDSLSLSAKW